MPSTRWYLSVTGQTLVVVLAIAVLLFIVFHMVEPQVEPF